ncbi:hypothetical protein CLU79DRAFT_727303 [Phycomyces nitens]|nr:hypothetical protein CLU79DRAFT_727303 [Phycomyces nitens]
MTQLASQALIPPSPNRSKRRRLPLRTAVDADFVSSPSKRHEAKEFLMYADTPEAKIVASNLKELWSPTDDNSYQKHSPVKVGTPTTHRESAQSQQFSKRPQNLMERLNAIETESLIDITMHSIVPRNIDDMFKASSKDQFGKRILGFKSFDNDSDDEATESVAVVEKAMERVEIHETVDFKQEENIEVQPTQESLQELNKNENETEGEASAEIKEALDIETALQDNHLPSTNYSPQDEIPTVSGNIQERKGKGRSLICRQGSLSLYLSRLLLWKTLAAHLTNQCVRYRLFVCTAKKI